MTDATPSAPAYTVAIVRKGQPIERHACTTGGDLRTVVFDLIRSQGGTIGDADYSGLIAMVGRARSMADIEGFAALEFGTAAAIIRPTA
ncbi:hypothetical protein [Streptomyces sp. H27-D2]|uniref:hypothetical protein n=1 Tax=Streptomyces sp. H27-D2 TaxID=3046304 RepID=UPI002DB8B67E|nr:hypothetical protein [Streptomyces sp. H27-D2]MEC4016046.1 hypothetical protein [Streptomyces sp. H27-D2]